MRATSVHSRRIVDPDGVVGPLIDTLSSSGDRLWPQQTWPPMRFDRALAAGAKGGHGFIRYYVEAYEPGVSIVFRLTGPRGFTGTHAFTTERDGDTTVLTHTIAGETTVRFAPKWFLVVQPLHDALMEDALDNAERVTTGAVGVPAHWSAWVRCLRWALRPRG